MLRFESLSAQLLTSLMAYSMKSMSFSSSTQPPSRFHPTFEIAVCASPISASMMKTQVWLREFKNQRKT